MKGMKETIIFGLHTKRKRKIYEQIKAGNKIWILKSQK